MRTIAVPSEIVTGGRDSEETFTSLAPPRNFAHADSARGNVGALSEKWFKEVSMGKFAEAVRSHRKHLVCAREADDPRERASAANDLRKDLDDMLASIDERFDAEDKLEWEWVREKEAL